MVSCTRRRSVSWVVFAAVMGLADVLLTAWWIRSAWGVAVSGVAITGLIFFVAWSLRPGA